MDECHNCGCVRDDHAKIGGSWCMNQDAQGPCSCRRFHESPAVPVVHPEPGDREATGARILMLLCDAAKSVSHDPDDLTVPARVNVTEAAEILGPWVNARVAAAVAAVRADLADQIEAHLTEQAEPWSYADGVARDATIRTAMRAAAFIRGERS